MPCWLLEGGLPRGGHRAGSESAGQLGDGGPRGGISRAERPTAGGVGRPGRRPAHHIETLESSNEVSQVTRCLAEIGGALALSALACEPAADGPGPGIALARSSQRQRERDGKRQVWG